MAEDAPSQFDREIKTQFPVARIKRLMQSDEDVGKVAQATPVVVAKALELFMIQLVDASCDRAKQQRAKRVGIPHLYKAVMEEEKFDFLRDVVAKHETQAQESKRGRSKAQKPGNDSD